MNQSNKKMPVMINPLDRVGWLSGESEEFRNWVITNGQWIRCRPKHVLYTAGDEPSGLFGLAHGLLEVSFPLDGDIQISVHRAEPGFWVGESALFSGEKRMVSLTAVSESVVLHIPAYALERRVEEHPETWRALYRQSHINLKQSVKLLAESIALTPRARFARLLLRLSERNSEVLGTQEGLGSLLGLRVRTSKRIVASLVEARAVQSGYGRIKILDRGALRAFAREQADG